MKLIMLRFKLYLFLFLFHYVNSSFAQIQNSIVIPSVTPPSPDATSLGKYGNTPVGLHTGIPDINIPLYTIKAGNLEVPISISYHAGGIKVNEEASRIGIGWTLNAGGAVSRSIVGLCDENGFWSQQIKNSSQVVGGDNLYLRGIADGTYDGESDYYFYNFNGRSGKFIYRQNQNSNPFIIPEVPLKITGNSSDFKILDESGRNYVFGAKEITTKGLESYTSTFYLSEIKSPDDVDHIYFSYTGDQSHMQGGTTYLQVVGPKCSSDQPTGPPADGSDNTSSETTPVPSLTSTLRLQEINFANGKVVFAYTADRKDSYQSRLSKIEIYVKRPDGSLQLQKLFRFKTGYFQSGLQEVHSNYWLRLEAVEEKDRLDTLIGKTHFFYNESTMLPSRSSTAQDWWGFYNGKVANQGLIATETIDFGGIIYQVGNANRDPDTTYMKAGILEKIVYPTGGYTEYNYEAHSYTGTTKTPQSVQASAGLSGDATTHYEDIQLITPSHSGWAKINAFCSDATTTFSSVILRRQNDDHILLSHIYDPAVYIPFLPESSVDYWVYLTGGVSYELIASSQGQSSSTLMGGAAFSKATAYWNDLANDTTAITGGLRIKEILDYPGFGAAPIAKLFKYGIEESGEGILLVPPDALGTAKQENSHEFYRVTAPTNQCVKYCEATRLTISSRPVYDLSSLNGAPVIYPEVTVYEQDSQGRNGKSVHRFDVEQDEIIGAPKQFNNGRYQINNSWRGGDEIYTQIFPAGSSTPVKERENVSGIVKTTESLGTKVGWKVQIEGGCTPFNLTEPAKTFDFFYVFDHPYYSGVKKILSSTERVYGQNGPGSVFEIHTNFHYANLATNHQQLSKKITLASNGDTLTSKYWYPADYMANAGNTAALLAKNIIGQPIKEEKYRNGLLLAGRVSELDDNGNLREVYDFESAEPRSPNHDPNTIVPGSPEYAKRATMSYNAQNGRIESIQMSDNTVTSYLWGYNNTLLIAEISNGFVGEKTTVHNTPYHPEGTVTASVINQIFGSNFNISQAQTITPSISVTIIGTNAPSGPGITLHLKNANGNEVAAHDCSWGSNSVYPITLLPGSYQWYYTADITTGNGYNGADLDMSFEISNLLTGYRLFHTSFEEDGILNNESKTGARVWAGTYRLNLPGDNGEYRLSYWKKTGVAPWTLIEQTVSVTTNTVQSVLIGDTGSIIDEVRMMPAGAMMTTYTHDPIVGITSKTDTNNLTAYYEYDAFGRLSAIKDHDGNIVKTFQYNFKN